MGADRRRERACALWPQGKMEVPLYFPYTHRPARVGGNGRNLQRWTSSDRNPYVSIAADHGGQSNMRFVHKRSQRTFNRCPNSCKCSTETTCRQTTATGGRTIRSQRVIISSAVVAPVSGDNFPRLEPLELFTREGLSSSWRTLAIRYLNRTVIST